MRLLSVVCALASLAIVAADLVLFGFGRAFLAREAERIERAHGEGQARAARAAVAEAVKESLDQLVAREARRSWREHGYLYVPPGSEVAGQGFAIHLSPIRDLDPNGLVRARFTLDEQGLLATPWRAPRAEVLVSLYGADASLEDDPERAAKEARLARVEALRLAMLAGAQQLVPAPDVLHDVATAPVLQGVAYPVQLARDLAEVRGGNVAVQKKLEALWNEEQTINREFRSYQKQNPEATRSAERAQSALSQQNYYDPAAQQVVVPPAQQASAPRLPGPASLDDLGARIARGLGLGPAGAARQGGPAQGAAQAVPQGVPQEAQGAPDAEQRDANAASQRLAGAGGQQGGPGQGGPSQQADAAPSGQQAPGGSAQQALRGSVQSDATDLAALLERARDNDASVVLVSPYVPLALPDPEAPGGHALFFVRAIGVTPWLYTAPAPAYQGFEVDAERLLQVAEEALARQGFAVVDTQPRPVAGLGPATVTVPGLHVDVPLPEPVPHLAVTFARTEPAAAAGDPLATTRALLYGAALLILFLGSLGPAGLYALLWRRTELVRRRTDFVAAVSHELKAPLAGIRAMAEMLATGLVRGEAKAAEYHGHILHESERLSRIIQNVLDLAKIERGARGYALDRADPSEALREAAASFRGHLEREGIRFEVEVPATLPAVPLDRDALVQAVTNLLDNAAKYGRPDAGQAPEPGREPEPLAEPSASRGSGASEANRIGEAPSSANGSGANESGGNGSSGSASGGSGSSGGGAGARAGGTADRVTGPRPQVALRAAAAGPGAVVIEVADNGPGIPADERRRIFEPFYRGRRHLVGAAGGAGLGLAIAKSHLEAMGGALDLAGSATGGACFRLRLGATAGAAGEATRGAAGGAAGEAAGGIAAS